MKHNRRFYRNYDSINRFNVEDVWVDVQKGWYVPLDKFLEEPNPFVHEKGDPAAPGYNQWWDMFQYQAISRGKAGPDGKTYCISLDMVETGIFYNKDIFREAGVDVPRTWEEFMDILERIQKTGRLPLIMHLDWFNDWAVDLFIDQMYHDILPGIDLFKDPIREPYLQGYLDWDEIAFLYQKGFFTSRDPRYAEVWRIMKELKKFSSDNMTTSDVVREFVTGNGAMIWNNSCLTYPLTADPEIDFDWGVFYLPPFTKKTSPLAPETPSPMCVIGGSATQFEVTNSAYNDTGDPDTSVKLQRTIAFLQFLTLPENCEEVVNEYSCFIPNIVGVPVLEPLKPFEEILKREYTTTKFTYTFDLRFGEVQRRALELYLMGGMSLDELLVWQDKNMDAAVKNVMQRKGVDMDRLQQSWDALAPMRAQAIGLPDED